ncbi:MAG TPA: hypothetical protein VN802_05605 [Stellaceae bacterium]|nr:hypothetical protein [Stellaceae bacterium]
MARNLNAAPARRFDFIALPEPHEIVDLIERGGKAPFDPSYGDSLAQLLPRRLSELLTRH